MRLLIGGSPCTYWMPVSGYEGLYEVSYDGFVRNAKTKRVLSVKTESNGYCRVHLSNKGVAKSMLLHRIVATAFIPNPNGYKTVNHIDENKGNNKAKNLEWCDMSYQNRYGRGAERRNKAKERAICEVDDSGNVVREWESIKTAANALGLHPQSVWCVCAGKKRYKSTGGHRFRYKEVVLA